jgi:hippurate hydrolase
MGSEDFAFMLEQQSERQLFHYRRRGRADRCMVHNPGYDFNDALLLTGAALWCGLTEHYLR